MNWNNYYKVVENILKKFPLEWQKNYEENKKDVIIKKEEVSKSKIFGNYDNEKNIITLYNEESLPHELFHMAFRNRNKLNQKLFEDANLIYDNGVAYHDLEGNIYGNALTEGFVEYLSRKCSSLKGHNMEYYFVNLLIQIHGEEILKYSLTNDSLNFYQDKCFSTIHEIRKELDLLMSSSRNIQIISIFKDIFIENLNNNEYIKETYQFMKIIKDDYINAIVRLFNLITIEYINTFNPQVSINEFINLLNDFLVNKDYQVSFYLAEIESYPLKEKVEEIINNFKLEYKIVKKK